MIGRVLAAEDSPTQGEQLVALLEGADFEVVLTRSGEEALEAFAGGGFDLVVSDVVMPGIDGYQLCRRIKQQSPDLPVVLLTSLTDPFEVVHGLEAGADNFLRKPYEADQLVSRIRTMLHNAELRAGGRAQMGLELFFLGQRFMITADRQQMLDLLVSTFEDLVTTHREVRFREEQLVEAHTELATQLAATEQERRRLDAVLAAVPEAMVIVDEGGVITGASDAAGQLFDCQSSELLGRTAAEVARFFDAEAEPIDPGRRPLRVALERAEFCEAGGAFDLFLERPDATRVPVIARGAPVRNDAGRVIGAVGMLHEIGGLANHDPLTGLPGHALFAEAVMRGVVRAAEVGRSTAVLVIAVDRFERVRGSLGPAANDVIALVGRRIHAAVQIAASATAAYLGGEQFAVLLPEMDSEFRPLLLAHVLADEIAAPLTAQGLEIQLTASIGIAMSSESDASSAVQLVSAAAAAARRASSAGGARCEVFDPSMGMRAADRLRAEADLRRAIEDGELVVYYQPELELASGRAVGAEALVRWNHPGRGLVPPNEFIPLAEETGLVVQLGWWVLREACRQAAAWRTQLRGGDAFTISVNVSTLQMSQPDMAQQVRRALAGSGLDPTALLLEITETGIMVEGPDLERSLEELRELGVRMRIDDFGTGYSSLMQLRRLPVHALKVDRSFVDGMISHAEDGAIVESTVRLAHALGLQVVAEGVERDDQLAGLRELGCDLAQGYLWSPPLPGEVFEAWWHETMARPRAPLSTNR